MNLPIGPQNINFPGYGLFWVANSVNSTLLGSLNRSHQERAHDRNLEFQKELLRAREITEDEKIAEEIAFKRRLLAIGRQYKLEESAKSFELQLKLSEMKYFLDHYWPLDPSMPWNLLSSDIPNAIKGGIEGKRLNVILIHTPFLPPKRYNCGSNDEDDKIYNKIEYQLSSEDSPLIGDIRYRKDSCIKADLAGGNATIMNIHFLMSQIPTLVIQPHYFNGKISFTGAVWEPQASRPLIRNLFSIDHSQQLALEDISYRNSQIELFHTSVAVIAGMVRDSYMLITEGKKPTLPLLLEDQNHKQMKSLVLTNSVLLNFVNNEKISLLKSIDISSNPNLIDLFHKEDLGSMRRLIENSKL